MAAPSMTFNAAGNVRASSASNLTAGGTLSDSVDVSAKYEMQIFVKNTPGASVAATRGVRVDVLPRYGTGPTDATLAMASYILPSAAASTAESAMVARLPTGKYTIKYTNLDASNAVTIEVTSATVDSIA